MPLGRARRAARRCRCCCVRARVGAFVGFVLRGRGVGGACVGGVCVRVHARVNSLPPSSLPWLFPSLPLSPSSCPPLFAPSFPPPSLPSPFPPSPPLLLPFSVPPSLSLPPASPLFPRYHFAPPSVTPSLFASGCFPPFLYFISIPPPSVCGHLRAYPCPSHPLTHSSRLTGSRPPPLTPAPPQHWP